MTQPRQEVKMKHFSFEFNQKEIPESFEERVNVLREIGKKAKKDFEEKYHQLSAWFKDYDALYPENTKGALLIAVNLDKQHYPYSALATKLSSELFDSRFSGMTISYQKL